MRRIIIKKAYVRWVLLFFFATSLNGCAEKTQKSVNKSYEPENNYSMNKDSIVFGAGCFWCVEAVFQNIKGVLSVTSGYMGGKISNPTYKEVCSGLTGHAEVVQIVYNPELIAFEELLEVFFETHDPTTLNRQGNDIGTKYRSAIFYFSNDQKVKSEKYKQLLNQEKIFPNPVVTEISPATIFYKAEEYHQNYYNLNKAAPYCSFVIKPKLDKLRKKFSEKLNERN
ncbi:MAG: peptide-methionine (S)-S-oxide reductase MsrA [Cytophagaceae bacterium]